jgi:hypothetical protein
MTENYKLITSPKNKVNEIFPVITRRQNKVYGFAVLLHVDTTKSLDF